MKFIVQDFKVVPIDASPGFTFQGADCPDRIYEFYLQVIEAEFGYEPEKEHVVVICLNARMNVIGWHMVSIGGLCEATCHPREVLKPVIVRSAHSFVLAHNHPSGDPTPSQADTRVTNRMVQAAGILQISMVDHVIIGKATAGRCGYYSFREAGII